MIDGPGRLRLRELNEWMPLDGERDRDGKTETEAEGR